jgi:stress response protein SCP2
MSLLNLTKAPTALTVTKLAVGAEWDAKGHKNKLANAILARKGADLDLIAVCFQRGRAVRYAGWENLNPVKGVTHSGDSKTGAGSGDDELVDVDLAQVPVEVDKILFIIGTKEKSFNSAKNVSFNMYDKSSGEQQQLAPSIWPELGKRYNALSMLAVERAGEAWTVKMIEKFGNVQFNEDNLLAFANANQ